MPIERPNIDILYPGGRPVPLREVAWAITIFQESLKQFYGRRTCAKYLLGCFQIIRRHSAHVDSDDLLTDCHELYNACVWFLGNSPADESTFRRLENELSVCKCNLRDALTRRAHNAYLTEDTASQAELALYVYLPNTVGLPPPTMQGIVSAVTAVVSCVPIPDSNPSFVLEKRRLRRLQRQVQNGDPTRVWPGYPSQLVPDGTEAFIRSLERLVERYNPKDFVKLLSNYAEFFRREIVQYIISSKFLPGAIMSHMDTLVRQWNSTSDRIFLARDMLLRFEFLSSILESIVNFSDVEELMHMVNARFLRPAPRINVVENCMSALHVIPQIVSAFPVDRIPSGDVWRLKRDCDHGIISLAAHVHFGLRRPDDDALCHKDILERRKDIEIDETAPELLVVNGVERFTSLQRCFNPGCTVTGPGLGRRMRRCGGCKAVTYCSRQCQVSTDWRLSERRYSHLCRVRRGNTRKLRTKTFAMLSRCSETRADFHAELLLTSGT